ncbi:MAG: adenylyl-sulfate kinase [Acidovorax sp.]|uniref:adenylyl-sulfate kinase n=1 Tax=Acidovorax sp. TaxID=1872122 RepID=UPI00391BCBB9
MPQSRSPAPPDLHTQPFSVTRAQREGLHRHAGRAVWLTGLSGAGKSTTANALESALHAQGRRTYVLDGDYIRNGLNRDLGFGEQDRNENIRRVAEVARMFVDAGTIVIAAFISPLRAQREAARSLFAPGDFLEVFVSTPLAVAETRDPKGLYRKARNGQLPQFTGVDAPYEPPLNAELVLPAHLWSTEQCVQALMKLLDTAPGSSLPA